MKQSKLVLSSLVFGLVICASAFTTLKHMTKSTSPSKLWTKGGNAHVNGGGTAVEGGEKSTFVFNAVELPDGSVNGHLVYNYRAGDNEIHMDLTCLRIFGNKATLSGVVTSATGDLPSFISVGAAASFTVEDNGQGKGDKFSNLIFGAGSFTSSCADNWATYILVSGNISIKE
jgi:hypothetical protein